MGAEKPGETKDGVAPQTEKDEEEDEPIIKDLKKLDDDYLKLEREFEAEERALRAQFEERLKPLLDERSEVLGRADKDEEKAISGTPALKSFWLNALRNHPGVEDLIQEHDEPILEFLKDIRWIPAPISEDDHSSFALEFTFIENPYFDETILQKKYVITEPDPYNGEQDVKEISATSISWKPGKDVTVEVKKKKVKGKQAKEKIEPRHSFFRDFFVALKQGETLPQDCSLLLDGVADNDDMPSDAHLLDYVINRDAEIGTSIKENIIPFAIRWFTGEAAPEEDDDDEDEESEEEDEDNDDDNDDDDDEDDEKPSGKAKSTAQAKSKAAANEESVAKAKEDCKQQ